MALADDILQVDAPQLVQQLRLDLPEGLHGEHQRLVLQHREDVQPVHRQHVDVRHALGCLEEMGPVHGGQRRPLNGHPVDEEDTGAPGARLAQLLQVGGGALQREGGEGVHHVDVILGELDGERGEQAPHALVPGQHVEVGARAAGAARPAAALELGRLAVAVARPAHALLRPGLAGGALDLRPRGHPPPVDVLVQRLPLVVFLDEVGPGEGRPDVRVQREDGQLDGVRRRHVLHPDLAHRRDRRVDVRQLQRWEGGQVLQRLGDVGLGVDAC